MRLFELHRIEDKSGVSGTGIVAEGVCFTDGTAVMRWLTQYRSTALYANMDELETIHGHGGTTKIVWKDSPGEPVAEEPKKALTLKELFNLDDSRIDSDFDSFTELWDNLTAYVTEHPDYQYFCADDPGYQTRRIPRFGWVAYESEATPKRAERQWTIPASKMKQSVSQLHQHPDTAVIARMLASASGRREMLENIVKVCRQDAQVKKFTGA